MHNNQQKMCNRSKGQVGKLVRGIALVEALVSILIFTTGILGMVGLQAAMMRAQGSAKYRADAAALAGELIGTMWGESANASSANLVNYVSTPEATCTHTPCVQWLTKVASSLPKGAAVVVTDASTGRTTVSISWTLPTDGLHTYVTTTSIR